jgi:hypothetical protein
MSMKTFKLKHLFLLLLCFILSTKVGAQELIFFKDYSVKSGWVFSIDTEVVKVELTGYPDSTVEFPTVLVDYIYFSKDKIFYPNPEDVDKNYPREKNSFNEKYPKQAFEFGLTYLYDAKDFFGVDIAYYFYADDKISFGFEMYFDINQGDNGFNSKDVMINYYTLNAGSEFSMLQDFITMGIRLKGGLALVKDYYGRFDERHRTTLGFTVIPEVFTAFNLSKVKIVGSFAVPQTLYKNGNGFFGVDGFVEESYWSLIYYDGLPKVSLVIPLNKSPKSNQ